MNPRLPALIAHRGASGYAPENTLASFELALKLGAGAIEFDVQQTKDGRLVVIHDPDLKRVAGVRRRIGSLTYLELSQHDVGAWFDAKYRGERVPLLEELLDLAQGRAELHLEIKNGTRPYPGIEERIVNLLRRRREWDGRVIISSFNHETLYLVRALDGSARLGYLVGLTRRAEALKEAAELGCESVHMSARQVDRAWVESLHERGRKLLVYTVNEPKDYERLRGLGVDAVFTNFPDLGRLRREPAPGRAPS
ncbi:MAG: glycerophosphodiester phosphodiesterase [Elusimicrobia bacterium]|nr:glycerophosphodiester phosphodiesterase [Elusimicrobiota bacterium]